MARHLGRGDAVAVATGQSEFGPRALGHRSILASARDPAVSERLNRALSRSDFMPFAPALLAEEAEASVEGLDRIHHSARFMTACVQARPALVGACPAVVHRDGKAIAGTWSRSTPYDRFVFRAPDGTEIPLDAGTTWLELSPT